MDSTDFGKIWTYRDVYSYLSQGNRSKEEIKAYLKRIGKSESSANDYCRKVANAEVPFIVAVEGSFAVEQEELIKALIQTCEDLNLAALIEPKKRGKKDEAVAAVTRAHSPKFNELNEELRQAKAEAKRCRDELAMMQQQLVDKTAKDIITCMEKKTLILSGIKSDPPEVLARDFFGDGSNNNDRKHESRILESLYQIKDQPEKNLTEANYLKRVLKSLNPGKLLKARLQAQEKDELQFQDNERTKAIELLLADEQMDNQTKLATYAFWYFEEDEEMQRLLEFAGENAINANYVIRLLEKPKELRNYRTMRAFLQQARMASEAHIKRQTVQELLCGDWQVVADYCGKEAHFRLLPLEELQVFRELLGQKNLQEAKMVLENVMSSTFGPVDQKSKTDETEDENTSEAPSFLHEGLEGLNLSQEEELPFE